MYTVDQIERISFKARLKHREEKAKKTNTTLNPFLRRSWQVQGFLTSEQIIKLWQEGDRDQLIWSNLCVITDGKKYFLTDDHTFGTGVLPKNWIHASIGVHPDLHLDTLQEYLTSLIDQLVFQDEERLRSLEELVGYLNADLDQ